MNDQSPKLSLLETVRQAQDCGNEREALAAILACADWLESQNVGVGVVSARWLREGVQGE